MKNYMNRWVLLALKAIVILVWLACLWGQLFAVPGLSGALAGLYPSQTSMHWHISLWACCSCSASKRRSWPYGNCSPCPARARTRAGDLR